MSASAISRSEMDRRMDEFDLARRALRWIIEHRAYWDPRTLCLMEPSGVKSTQPLCLPPEDIQIFLLSLAREVDLEAESAF